MINYDKKIYEEMKQFLATVGSTIDLKQKIQMFDLHNKAFKDNQSNYNCSACVRLVYQRCLYYVQNYVENQQIDTIKSVEKIVKIGRGRPKK